MKTVIGLLLFAMLGIALKIAGVTWDTGSFWLILFTVCAISAVSRSEDL